MNKTIRVLKKTDSNQQNGLVSYLQLAMVNYSGLFCLWYIHTQLIGGPNTWRADK